MRHGAILLTILFLGGCDAPVAAELGKNHRVLPGESLFALAERAYGNGLEWPRIWEANPWVDPDHLRAGEVVFIPPRDASWGDPPPPKTYASNPGTGDFEELEHPVVASGKARTSSNPGNKDAGAGGGLRVFRNLATNVSQKTLFGVPIEKMLLFLFLCFLAHAVFQGVLVWLAANITFVKDASFKKSLKAVLLTEMLTFSTLIVLGGVATLMLYLGSEPTVAAGQSQLFPTLEGYLQSPTGILVASFALLGLYLILSLRFLPQVFGVPMSRTVTLVTLAILIPHLLGLYLIGQRTGMIQ